MTPGSENGSDGRPESDAEWESRPERLTEAREADPIRLMLDLEGFEGPLDVLLVLARDQKVDLMRVSIVALADQYLAFIEAARTNHLDLAVDYLVMAAWLTYLKSRLLLPVQKDDDEPSAEDLAEELARRLRRLEAIRAVAARMMNRPQMGRDIFLRGLPETRETKITKVWDDTLYDLLSAYAFHQRRIQTSVLHIEKRTVWSLSEARETLIRLVGEMADWMPLDTFLTPFLENPEDRTTVLASSFTASLELAREGALELQQSAAFEPLYIRTKRRKGPANDEDPSRPPGDTSRDG
ncbi:MAG: ScpA family protein [Pseudomonadota bacterium]